MESEVVVLISGQGTNLEYLMMKKINIVQVISNKKGVRGLEIAGDLGIVVESSGKSREEFELQLLKIIKPCKLVILAGFMRILTKTFIDGVGVPIINLHPSIPNGIRGNNAIRNTWDQKLTGGAMAHLVDYGVDTGQIICYKEVAWINDYLEFEKEVKRIEKNVLYDGIMAVLNMYKGKVRDCYPLGDKMLVVHSDRLSAFDRYICDINGKGELLCAISAWWFCRTRHIIRNHYISHQGRNMTVWKCEAIPIEVVVRGYLAGNTKTSIWMKYCQGQRRFGNTLLKDNMKKKDELEIPIITPTTKGITDEEISGEEIIEKGICTKDEWNIICDTAIRLYEFGRNLASMRGIILADTKYEFGRFIDGKLMLIDELHTPDSSRYWKAGCSLDKDFVRDYIRSKCDPYSGGELPEIDCESVRNIYSKITELICL